MRIHQKNKFIESSSGVWMSQGAQQAFAYSDGSEIEQRLEKILKGANDLSSSSYELMSHITDWPTEYHLTGKRANLLKGIDLSKVNRVLELGCGCGSITRYLGELGIEVDSVEGSPIRAELARLRTRDQDNVTISTANFNEIEFEADYYDLVLFVGVTEYAGRFSRQETDVAALQELLAQAKGSLNAKGVVLVAIENRTGAKYLMGACEDHYGKPFVGINNYPQSEGIRTYTKGEWLEQITDAGFSESEFLYPFPDYKIPTSLLSENCLKQDAFAYRHTEELRSRDYLRPFKPASREVLQWEAYAANQQIDEYANSFLILIGNNKAAIESMSVYDFAHFPSFTKQADYAVTTTKLANSSQVDYSVGLNANGNTNSAEISEAFVSGIQLSAHWVRELISELNDEKFIAALKVYFEYLKSQSDSERLIANLPNQIFVSPSSAGDVDTWQLTRQNLPLPDNEAVSPELALYRALRFMWTSYRELLQDAYGHIAQGWSLEAWFINIYQSIGNPITAIQLSELIELDEAYRKKVYLASAVIDVAQSFLPDSDVPAPQAEPIVKASLPRRVARRIKRSMISSD